MRECECMCVRVCSVGVSGAGDDMMSILLSHSC